jgi:hypothetical protein
MLRPRTLKVTMRDWPTPIAWFVNPIVTGYVPEANPLATAPTETNTLAASPPAAIVPLLGSTVSQAEVLIRVQLRALVPRLVRVKYAGLGVNDPPTGPDSERPGAGVMNSGPGRS